MPEIQIVYEDNHLLVVVKPPNVLSQADAGGDEDMLTLLKDFIKMRDQKPGNVFMGLVHRLDRPVGGLMVFAKTSKAASRLSESVRARTFDKLYHAVVHGFPNPQEGRLKHWLRKNESTQMVSVVNAGTKDGKEAILDYQVLRTTRDYSLIQVKLLTGRPHQIRVQCAHSGFPIVGDRKYGKQSDAREIETIALWAVELGFPHPVRDEWMHFQLKTPATRPWIEI